MKQKRYHSWFIKGKPISGGQGGWKNTLRKKEFRNIIKKEHRLLLLKGEVKIRFIFWYKDNHNLRFDLDNMVKFFCDVLTGVAYEDDAQIVYLRAEKKKNQFLEGVTIEILK